ncbi:hypothetical protein SLNSH_16440 [Alsobacter soli]|uniref:Uncharacterized protein n=1 Tax=Alsobacter soli TaxID=2109933 RepID=A0A2T1HQE4_9HYPH|nr:hypothetical protein [Alsobacter soli]PSC03863.1 hypothetical protein SLNSH_16440 [Alsobacter soli]
MAGSALAFLGFLGAVTGAAGGAFFFGGAGALWGALLGAHVLVILGVLTLFISDEPRSEEAAAKDPGFDPSVGAKSLRRIAQGHSPVHAPLTTACDIPHESRRRDQA